MTARAIVQALDALGVPAVIERDDDLFDGDEYVQAGGPLLPSSGLTIQPGGEQVYVYSDDGSCTELNVSDLDKILTLKDK